MYWKKCVNVPRIFGTMSLKFRLVSCTFVPCALSVSVGPCCVESVVSKRETGKPSSSLSSFEERFREMENMHEQGSRRLLLRIPEVMSTLGLGRTKVYELIAKGELPVVRVGRAVRVSSTALEKWIEARQQQDSAV